MDFVMGDILGFGMVGWVYYTTTGYILSRVIFFGIILFAIIGFFTVIKWVFRRKKPKETAGQKWMRTGRTD